MLQADRNETADPAGADSSRLVAVAVGANLAGPFGPPLQTCHRAVAEMAGLAFLRLVGVSAWYATEPVPKSMQPDFVNGVAVFAASGAALDPAFLLRALQAIERQGGRERSSPDAPRTLDLDIVMVDDLIRAAPDPVLPHPLAHRRRFVLEPLRDVLPDWRHPVLGRPLRDLLAALPPGGTRRLADGQPD